MKMKTEKMQRNTAVYLPPKLKTRLLTYCIRHGQEQGQVIAEALAAFFRRKTNTNRNEQDK